MALVGVSRIDDGIREGIKEREKKLGELVKKSERKVINVEADLVDAINEYAEELEDRFGFKPTFAQALKFILKELRNKKL
jgi:hypothetical protein